MPTLTIDDRSVTVPDGATILDAANALGIEIPTMCFAKGGKPFTSCMVCLVRDLSSGRMLPSCSYPAADGMRLEAESEAVAAARRSVLDLLMSEHVGDCEAPCRNACPAFMDIALMNRQIAAGAWADALVTVKRHIPLPAVLGRICPAPCERPCRRRAHDEAVSICLLKRIVADRDLASDQPYLPPCKDSSGRKVAVVGAGPAGLSAAYYLLQDGHACTVFDREPEAGGAPRHTVTTDRLPRDVLDAEIEVIRLLGARFELGKELGKDFQLDELRKAFDAVVLAVGDVTSTETDSWGVARAKKGFQIDKNTFQTDLEDVFVGGAARRPVRMAVSSVADGRLIALSIDAWLSGRGAGAPPRTFNSRIGPLQDGEIEEYLPEAETHPRVEPGADDGGYTEDEATREARRCLHCDCRAGHDCRLRDYADRYGASAARYRGGDRKRITIERTHADVVYEPGKCIKCGLCVRITREAAEPIGLTFVGRGFDVEVAPPMSATVKDALQKTAEACVEACPTGAIAWKHPPAQPAS